MKKFSLTDIYKFESDDFNKICREYFLKEGIPHIEALHTKLDNIGNLLLKILKILKKL